MVNATHYHTLSVSPSATQADIKRSYRQLVKRFHPDSNRHIDSHEAIAQINAAYEILSDPQTRRSYDRQLGYGQHKPDRQADRGPSPRQRRRGRDADEHLRQWLQRVYQPVNRELCEVLYSLDEQIDDLAADPFDDELMDDFQAYLEQCREALALAHQLFQSMPNPASVAGAAANLYYCLSQLSDGVDELDRFTASYAEHYIHTGQELFRIAHRLRQEAEAGICELGMAIAP